MWGKIPRSCGCWCGGQECKRERFPGACHALWRRLWIGMVDPPLDCRMALRRCLARMGCIRDRLDGCPTFASLPSSAASSRPSCRRQNSPRPCRPRRRCPRDRDRGAFLRASPLLRVFRIGREVLPLVRIGFLVVKFLVTIRIADEPPVLGARGVVLEAIRRGARRAPLGLWIVERRADALSLDMLRHGDAGEIAECRIRWS